MRGEGLGVKLVAAAEKETRARGVLGSACGVASFVSMVTPWLKTRGRRHAGRVEVQALLRKPFARQVEVAASCEVKDQGKPEGGQWCTPCGAIEVLSPRESQSGFR